MQIRPGKHALADIYLVDRSYRMDADDLRRSLQIILVIDGGCC